MPALKCLNFDHRYMGSGRAVVEGLRAVSRMPGLTSLSLPGQEESMTDEVVHAMSKSITSLDIRFCYELTDKALAAVSKMPALTSLSLSGNERFTNKGILALSKMPALTKLDLAGCKKVTPAGVQALRKAHRKTAGHPDLHIKTEYEPKRKPGPYLQYYE